MTDTSTVQDKHSHIPTSEVLQDIADTETEILTWEREIYGFRLLGDRWSQMRADARSTRIREAKEFIAKLQEILKLRGAL